MQQEKISESPETAIIESPAGLSLVVLDLGATIRSLEVPIGGALQNVVLSYSDTGQYRSDEFYVGATVGPFANRMGGARFELDGKEFILDANDMPAGHSLHGGVNGLHQHRFAIQQDDTDKHKLECHAVLPDGAGGYPGNRTVTVIYQLVNDHTLAIDYRVTTDRDTVVSLANHAYFNLGGAIEDHELILLADTYTPLDSTRIPTGEIASVADTEFDLRTLTKVDGRVYDNNFVLKPEGYEPQLAATLCSPESGLQLDLLTTQPALQLYTADYLEAPFAPRQGICLEAQGFPNAPNQPGFPSARLAAGSTYRQRTIYRFSQISS